MAAAEMLVSGCTAIDVDVPRSCSDGVVDCTNLITLGDPVVVASCRPVVTVNAIVVSAVLTVVVELCKRAEAALVEVLLLIPFAEALVFHLCF